MDEFTNQAPTNALDLEGVVALTPPSLSTSTYSGPENAYGVAHELLSRRAAKEALEVLEPALDDEPANTGLLSLRAWAYMIRAQLSKAEADLRVLVEKNPSDDWALHGLGRVLERQSRHAEALPHLRLAAIMSDDFDHQVAVNRVQRIVNP